MAFDEVGANFLTPHPSQSAPDPSAEIVGDDTEWPERCEYWISETGKSERPRGRRERRKEPLVLCGHGVSLCIDNGALVIKNGFTHFPQTQETFRYFKGDLALPPRIIVVNGDGSLSFDAIAWLGQQDVALVTLDWHGDAVSVVGGAGYAADPAKVRWQVETRSDPVRRLAFSTALIREKLANSIETLRTVVPPSKSRDSAIRKAGIAVDQLSCGPPADLTALRLIEATCASAYFAAWRGVELKWAATSRRPVPDDWRCFTSRTSLANGAKLKNVNASHPLNAILNYAYAVLQAQLQIRAVADGYDPMLGIMHHGRRDRDAPAYVFDVMEPERPKVDGTLLRFVAGQTFSAADFTLRPDGVCRLAPQLARRLCTMIATSGAELTARSVA